ncbi:MAG: 50S ribosomal protein L5 [Candidatus Omnitrophica bacterium]|nr:50S ribosomal protein L5 [Candidatus Omnitrophota bacterium]
MARLKETYKKEITPAMMQRFNYTNSMAVPRIKAIVVNMGLGEGASDDKIMDEAVREMGVIVGQKPVVTKARKAIANFKIRKGSAVGIKATLRKNMMYEFLDRLISVAIPRIKDFRGLSPNSFDGRGNYTFGVTEHAIFPELEVDKINLTKGMDVTIVTTAKTDEEARELLRLFGMPFRK